MKIAVLGAGMVGTCYMQAFVDLGYSLLGICDLKPTGEVNAWVEAAGGQVHFQPGEWLQSADVVISSVFGTAALALARQAFPFMAQGSLYVDMTTADPGDMLEASHIAQEHKVDFVDVAITGAVNVSREKTPLLIAGTKAQRVMAMYEPMGARLTVVGDTPGDAAALKLLRSIYTKGMEALAVECLVTAEKLGLTESLFDVLQDIDEKPLRMMVESMVSTHIPHSARRRNEVVEAQRQMTSNGLVPMVSPSVELLFARSAQALAQHAYEGKTTKEAIAWLSQHVMQG